MKCCIAALAIAICTQVGAQETTPHASPPAAAKNRGVSKLYTQQEAKKTKNPNSATSPVPSCVQCSNCCPVEQPHAQSEEENAKAAALDRLYRRYLCATIIGVCGGFIGIGLLIWQNILTRRSANAALKNAQALIDSERALVMVDLKLRDKGVEQINLGNSDRRTVASLNFICCNDGRSVAWVTEKLMVFKIVQSLPQEPDFSDPLDIFVNEPEPLVPSPSPKSSSVEKVQPMAYGWRGDSGNLVTLYGFVKYRDIFGKPRETRYGYSITIDNELMRLIGYPEYNKNM